MRIYIWVWAGLLTIVLAGCGGYQQSELVPPAPAGFKGVHGITVDNEGRVLVGSVVGASIYQIDPQKGTASVYIGPPQGMADDLEQGPDGTLVWTAFLEGKVYSRTPDGAYHTIAEGLPGMNSVAFRADGRLFATQVFAGDALWELHPTGEKKPRLIRKDMGGLNGFDFGPDDRLYGPLWFEGEVVSLDVDSGKMRIVADGFGIPAAVNFDSQGQLYVVDTQRGEVLRVDVDSGALTHIAKVEPAIDNLAIAPDDNIYITNMADNAVIHVNAQTGETQTVISAPLPVAADMALVQDEQGREVLYVAGVFSLSAVDTVTGEVTQIAKVFGDEIDYPMHVSASNGKLLLSSWSAGAVQLLDAKTHKNLGLYHEMGTPHGGVVVSDTEVLYVDLVRAVVVSFDPANHKRRKDVLTLKGLTEIVQGEAENIFYLVAGDGVLRWDRSAEGEAQALVSGLDNPEGLTQAADGALYLAEVGKRRIVRLTMQEGSDMYRVEELANNLPIGFAGPAGAPPGYLPTAVEVDSHGNIYYSSDINTAIYKLTPR